MTQTRFSPSIPSRPVYSGLVSCGSALSIMVADEAGAAALTDLARSDASVMDKAHLLLIGVSQATVQELSALTPRSLSQSPTVQGAEEIFDALIAHAAIGTLLFCAGSEGLIGQFSARAMRFGLSPDAIQSEHRGSVARRMQCVHCKGITEDVTTDPFICGHCGLTLFVRDHFSRRLGAFQGVCVDAETPGDIPETVEIRP
ncbi:MAG: hypothetical protein OIF47_10925 [Marinibacterium sp.]|nr:hypothetical protein [Marinibacterium sp.]